MTLRAHVIGSGPNGLTAAAILAENGIEVDVYERNEEIGGAAASARAFDGEALIDLGAAAHPLPTAARRSGTWTCKATA